MTQLRGRIAAVRVARIVLVTLMVWVYGHHAGAISQAAETGRIASRLLALGANAPDFHLPDVVSGKGISLETFADKQVLLVMMLCRHCPYVQHVKQEVARLARDYAKARVGIVAISSNDAKAYPDDAPDRLKAMAIEEGFIFPFCYDKTQDVGKAYTAVATPDFFLFDRDRRLVYRGQLDDSRPGNEVPATGRDVRAALDAVLAGQPVNPHQKKAVGCSIKWKRGQEPSLGWGGRKQRAPAQDKEG